MYKKQKYFILLGKLDTMKKTLLFTAIVLVLTACGSGAIDEIKENVKGKTITIEGFDQTTMETFKEVFEIDENLNYKTVESVNVVGSEVGTTGEVLIEEKGKGHVMYLDLYVIDILDKGKMLNVKEGRASIK